MEEIMSWNCEPPVMSADAQFNGAPDDYIQNMDHFVNQFNQYETEYQVGFSINFPRLIKSLGFRSDRKFESLSQNIHLSLRLFGERIVGKPTEFYRSVMTKPNYYMDFKGRDSELMNVVRKNWKSINSIYHKAFVDAQNHDINLDHTIDNEVDHHFHWLDHQLKAILKGYLKQKPRSQIIFLDVEAVNDGDKKDIINNPHGYFKWLEPVRYVTAKRFRHYKLKFLEMISGKGYHYLSSIPLHSNNQRGGVNSAMLRLMALGGPLQPETVDKLVTVKYGSRKPFPTPLLAQRAYQGAKKMEKFLQVSMADEMKQNLSSHGHEAYVNYSDTGDKLISLDLTSMLRQVDMAVFGSAASVYGKVWNPNIIRIPRSNSLCNLDYFNGDISKMLHTRGSRDAAWNHLRESYCRIPDGSEGMHNLINSYNSSKIKAFDDHLMDWIIDADYTKYLQESNYEPFRKRCPQICNDIFDNDRMKNPKSLQYVFREMRNSGFDSRDMLAMMYAIYTDPFRNVFASEDCDNKYSKAEWAKWPAILLPGI